MTRQRQAASYEAVLLEALQNLAPAAVQAATGKSVGWFHRISNPGNDLGLHIVDAAALEAAMLLAGQPGRFGVLFNSLVSDRVAQLGGERAPTVDMAAFLSASMVEAGDFARALALAEADGKIDRADLERLIAEAQDVVRLWTDLLNNLIALRRLEARA